MAIKPLPPEAKKVFQGKMFAVWQWEQTLFDGSQTTFERISRPDYAYVIGILPDQQILLIEDEQPDRDPVITPAGGKVDAGETPAAAALREFKEETGYSSTELTHFVSYRPHSKIEMQVHGFIARECTKTAEPQLEAGERVTPLILTFEAFLELGHNPTFRDDKLRIQLLEALIDPTKKKVLHELLYAR
ncbi:MAG: NUDIX hydrolase [Candidatus Andersenbacteria bacterium]